VNLYGFVKNNGINGWDLLGLQGPYHPAYGEWLARPRYGCCPEPDGARYDKNTHCCCDGEILQRKPKPTGVKRCRTGYHFYIQLASGDTLGFVNNLDGTISIDRPDLWGDPSNPRDTCSDIKLSPCKYDLEKFAQCLEDIPAGNWTMPIRPPTDLVLGNVAANLVADLCMNCIPMRELAMAHCKGQSKRDCDDDQ